MTIRIENRKSALTSLRARWVVFSLSCSLFLGSAFLFLRAEWQPVYALRWLVLSTAAMAYLLYVFWTGLKHNRRTPNPQLLPTLGAGNSLTLLRGALIAALVGFLLSPSPEGWLAWIPGILYTLACIADYLDGYLARITNHVTHLGEILDMSFDSVGVLGAALLAVLYGQVPSWYLSIALARYLFLAGLWLRERMGKPVYELPPSLGRRAFAGVQMGFIAGVLWPVFKPPETHIAATLFALPFLASFSRDWLFASGVLRPAVRHPGRLEKAFFRWLPVFFRLAIVLLAAGPLSRRLLDPTGQAALFAELGLLSNGAAIILLGVLECAVLLFVAVGAAGRVASIMGMCLVGLNQIFAGPTASQAFLIAAYTVILFLGTGALSVWTPENRMITHRAGEK